MIKLKNILLNEQQTKTVKGVEYWRKSEGEPWQAIDKCVKGNCHHGEGETIGEDGSFIGEFKNGKRWKGILTGPNGDQIYVNGKAEILREPEEKSGGFLSVALNSIMPTDYFNLLPVNAKAWVKDLVGIKKTITSKDFSVNDLLVLIEIVKRLKKEGRVAIQYYDYNKMLRDNKIKIQKQGIEKSFEDSIAGSIYRLRTTLGRARIGTNSEGQTVIVDTFDFNNVLSGEGSSASSKKRQQEKIIQQILNNPTDLSYDKARRISGAFGSADGEGAYVYINLGDEADI